MAIQINTVLTSNSGLTVPTGSYCVLDIHISTKKMLEVSILFYKNKSSFDGNVDAPFQPNNANLQARFSKQLTNQEYSNITNINLHQFVQNYLETIFGVGTTQLVQ
jgi:hypothetical protein